MSPRPDARSETHNRGGVSTCAHCPSHTQTHSRISKGVSETHAINEVVEKHTHTHTHTDYTKLRPQTYPHKNRPHSHTLVAFQTSVISCLEDMKAWAGFVTFVATVRRVPPSLEAMINFCYLHYSPEGFAIGLAHLSFPLRCFSNGNGIECAASWVGFTETLLSREGEDKNK